MSSGAKEENGIRAREFNGGERGGDGRGEGIKRKVTPSGKKSLFLTKRKQC
jgi:hypothetical protein